MSSLATRELRIDDYEEIVGLWRTVEGVEVAEGDSKDEIRTYLSRNPACWVTNSKRTLKKLTRQDL